jgi:hypothetical protein
LTYFLFLLLRLSFNVFPGLKRVSLIIRTQRHTTAAGEANICSMNKKHSDYKNFIPPETSTEDGDFFFNVHGTVHR